MKTGSTQRRAGVSARLLLLACLLLPACQGVTVIMYLGSEDCSITPTVVLEVTDRVCGNFTIQLGGSLAGGFALSYITLCDSAAPNATYHVGGYLGPGCNPASTVFDPTTVGSRSDLCLPAPSGTIFDVLGVSASLRVNCASNKTSTVPPPINRPLLSSQISTASARVHLDCLSDADCCGGSQCKLVAGTIYSACYVLEPHYGLCPQCPLGLHYFNGTCSSTGPAPASNATGRVVGLPLFAATDIPAGTKLPVASPLRTASISVCAPKAPGLVVDPYSTLTIQWTTSNMFGPSSVSVWLRRQQDPSFLVRIAASVYNDGSFDWTPLTSGLYFTAQNASSYFVRVSSEQWGDVHGDSAPFSFTLRQAFWSVSPTIQEPFEGLLAIPPPAQGVVPGEYGTLLNQNFNGVRCRFLYTSEDLGLQNGHSVLLSGISVQQHAKPLSALLNFQIHYYVHSGVVLSDEYMTEAATLIANATTITPTGGEGTWLSFSFDRPIKVTFPESLVLEMSHVNPSNERTGPSGTSQQRAGNAFYVQTATTRRVCAGSDSWAPSTPWPYQIETNAVPPQRTVANIRFHVIANLEESVVTTCGAAPTWEPVATDQSWVELAPSDCANPRFPSCRAGAGGVYYNGYFITFGGVGQEQGQQVMLNDVWAYSLERQRWKQLLRSECELLTTDRPSCRAYHSAVRVGRHMYVFGGQTPSGGLVDVADVLWRLDLAHIVEVAIHGFPSTISKNAYLWTKIANTQNVRPTFRHAATSDGGRVMYLFGGNAYHASTGTMVRTDQMFAYDVVTGKWSDLTDRSECCLAVGFLCNANSLNLCQSNASFPLSSVNCFSRHCKSGHSMVLYNNTLWAFGGSSGQASTDVLPSNSLIAMDLAASSLSWRVLDEPDCSVLHRPSCRVFHSSVVVNGDILIYGGQTARHPKFPSNDMWAYNPSSGLWRVRALQPCDSQSGAPPCGIDFTMVLTTHEGMGNYTNVSQLVHHSTGAHDPDINSTLHVRTQASNVLLFGGQTTAPGVTRFHGALWMYQQSPFIFPLDTRLFQRTEPLLKLVVSNLGLTSSYLRVTLSGIPCTNVSILATRTALACSVKPSAGQEIRAVVYRQAAVEVEGATPSQQLLKLPHVEFSSPAVPSLSFLLPAIGNYDDFGVPHTTKGGYTIQIEGDWFGSEETVDQLSVFVGSKLCTSWQFVSTKLVNCTVPPGTGANHLLRVVVGDQSSETNLAAGKDRFSYVPPVVHSVRYDQLDTLGGPGSPITVFGEEFGTPSLATRVDVGLGSFWCPSPTHVSDTEIRCGSAPPGVGQNLSVTVVVGGQPSAVTPSTPTVSYDLPQIFVVEFNTLPSTSGGSTIDVYGRNFGQNSVDTIGLVDNVACSSTTVLTPNASTAQRVLDTARNQAHTNVTGVSATEVQLLRCEVPPGSGSGVTLTVRAAGGVSPQYTTAAVDFHYQAPQITAVSPSFALVGTSSRVELRGVNMGADQSRISVLADGRPCTELLLLIAHNLVSCTLPSFDVAGSISLVMSVGGQDSTGFPYSVQLAPVPQDIKSVMWTLAGIFIAVDVAALAVLVVFRNHRTIKSASVLFSVLIVVGALMVTFAVFFLHRRKAPFCQLSIWLATLGFTLLYGSLVLKNYRIYLIFHQSQAGKLRLRPRNLHDAHLLLGLAALVLVDLILLSTFSALTSCERRTLRSGAGTVTVVILLILWKMTLLAGGVVIAVKNRIVPLKDFRERTQIAQAIYNLTFVVCIALPVIFALRDQVQGAYMLQGLILVVAPTSTLVILFGSRFYRLYKRTREENARKLTETASHSEFDDTTSTHESYVTSSAATSRTTSRATSLAQARFLASRNSVPAMVPEEAVEMDTFGGPQLDRPMATSSMVDIAQRRKSTLSTGPPLHLSSSVSEMTTEPDSVLFSMLGADDDAVDHMDTNGHAAAECDGPDSAPQTVQGAAGGDPLGDLLSNSTSTSPLHRRLSSRSLQTDVTDDACADT